MRYVLFVILAAGPAIAHTGDALHVHPHDGASWLGIVAALGIVTLAASMIRARVRADKRP